MHRRTAQATLAAVLSCLAMTATASANPVVMTDVPLSPTRLDITDGGVPAASTDLITVTATDLGATISYVITDPGVTMTVSPADQIANCTGSGTPTVTCTINDAGGKGVDVDLGAAGTQTVQTASLAGTWTATTNSLTGGPGNDTLSGNTGDDTFDGAAGADAFDGKAGIDGVDYSTRTLAVSAVPDDASSSGEGCPDTCEGDTISSTIENIAGGAGNDVLTGTAGANALAGGAGNDTLNGLAGADNLTGAAGNDTITGGLGNDALDGGADVDTLSYLNDGRASGVTVSLDANTSTGGATDASETDNVADGTFENIMGSVFADDLQGSTGNNLIDAQAGDDVIRGDSENATPVGADEVFGRGGTDTFSYVDSRHGAGISASLDDNANDGLADADGIGAGTAGEGDNIHSDVENLTGTGSSDTLSGSAGKNVLDGSSGLGGGIDTISYQGRTDNITASLATNTGPDGDTFVGSTVQRLLGGAGNDTLIGNGSVNRLDGAGGNDLLVGGLGGDTLVGGAGNNTVDYSQDARGSTGVDVDLSAGQQFPHASGTQEDTLATIQNALGTAFDDSLTGDTTDNVLVGGAGTDRLDGSSGDDALDPGTGTGDQVIGGNGTDTVTYAARTAAVTITLDAVADDGETGEADKVFPSVENALGGAGADTITGSAQANLVEGNGGNDTITTLAGADTVTAGAGKDSVSTGDGDDTVKLVDQTADDTTSCGAGADKVDADDIDPLNADCETVTRTAVPKPPAATPASTVSVDNPTVTEGNAGTSSLTFTVKLSAAQAAAVTVPVATADLTAKAGQDYTALSSSVAFAAGETSKTVVVPVIGDKAAEPDETFGLGLGKPVGNATLGTPGYGIGTITNDDAAVAPGKRTPKLTVSASPPRDRKAPYSFVVTGRLSRPAGVTAAQGCKGKVRVTLSGPKKTLRSRTTTVRTTCAYSVRVTLSSRRNIGPSGRVRVVARFLGNAVLKAKQGPSRGVRVG